MSHLTLASIGPSAGQKSYVLGLLLLCACGGSVNSQAQTKVPESSKLRGVVVEDLTSERLEVTLAGHGSLPEVVIKSLDQRSPAAAGGLQVGDVIANLYVTGLDAASDTDPHITASEFYRKATQCTADCLVAIESRTEPAKDALFKVKGIDVSLWAVSERTSS